MPPRPSPREDSFAAYRPPDGSPNTTRRGANAPRESRVAEVAGLRISHPDRVVYPALGLTKENLAQYYETIARWMLPEVSGRPLSLLRCPEGAEAPCSFVRHLHSWQPLPLKRVPIQEKTKIGEYLVADSVEALVTLVQLGMLEVHTWNARVDRLEQPDRLVLDLDPGPAVPWARVVHAAHELREVLGRLGLEAFPKMTGGKGIHLVVPLVPRAGWGECLQFARAIAHEMERVAPRSFTASMVKSARQGKIFVDYLRNHRAASSIAAYSSRAKPQATVAMPVAWAELTPALGTEDFTVKNAAARARGLERDPWEGYGRNKQSLRASMLRALER
jgi:bifunctional non-homologous end joining protein LigD